MCFFPISKQMPGADQTSGWASLPRPTELAHQLLAGMLREGDRAIDATCGNGHDTLFLARQVGLSGRVLAYDIQAAAITASRALVTEAGFAERVEFFEASHARLADAALPGSVATVMFNLGYLPGGDRAVITLSPETLAALDAAASVLRPGGWLCVTCYPGHAGGDDEASQVTAWMEARAGNRWRMARYGMVGTRRPAPCLWVAVKPD